MTHPYYVRKTQIQFERMGAPGADPMPVAEWAENAAGDQFALVTADGRIVGHGRNVELPPGMNALYVDRETCKKYGLTATIVDLACAELTRILGEEVCVITAWSVKTGHIFE